MLAKFVLSIGLCLSFNLIHADTAISSGATDFVAESELMEISQDQIHITKNGIFINLQGQFVPVSRLFSTSEGQYYCVKADIRKCPFGHPCAPWSSGCTVETCPYYSGSW